MTHAINPIRQTILLLLQDIDENKSIGPTDIAQHLAGKDEKQWSKYSKPIRAEAVLLAIEGKILILRKGKVVDPENFKGIYRLAKTNPTGK